jgi:undecaprenyl diphosphate synthase
MNLPQHLAIIMDGNGRWAKQRGKPRTYGHVKGTRVAKKIITACSRRGIKYLTLYAFSSENWLRPQLEVSFLMLLLMKYLRRETSNLVKENIKFDVIGELDKLPNDVLNAIKFAQTATAGNTGLHLTFAISYGSRQEIAQAAKKMAEDLLAGNIISEMISEANFGQYLQTRSIPDPDFIVRTSGEKRLSNFLLWQAAYSEFYFSETLWPDFTEDDLSIAIDHFSKRERRFGAIPLTENIAH